MNIALIAVLVAALNTASMTMSDKATVAIEDPTKVAEVMPTTPVEQERFKVALLNAIKTMPASPKEKREKFIAVYKAIHACTAMPEPMSGILQHDLLVPTTNSVEHQELDMDYGLWRKPKTVDKNRRYYPGWRRGDGAKGSNHVPMKEPDGYRWQKLQ